MVPLNSVVFEGLMFLVDFSPWSSLDFSSWSSLDFSLWPSLDFSLWSSSDEVPAALVELGGFVEMIPFSSPWESMAQTSRSWSFPELRSSQVTVVIVFVVDVVNLP